MTAVRIALIGDFSAKIIAHRAIDESLRFYRETLERSVTATWVPTDAIPLNEEELLSGFDGIWCVPGSPYANTDGALRCIQFARTRALPFFGTCGGFQHALLEYARNVLGRADASHEELKPDAAFRLISQLHCALVQKSQEIHVTGVGRFVEWFGAAVRPEEFHCRFGLNPEYERLLDGSDMQIVARSGDGEVRAIELSRHPFFVGTLFQPERTALRGEVHPLIQAFVSAAGQRRGASSRAAIQS